MGTMGRHRLFPLLVVLLAIASNFHWASTHPQSANLKKATAPKVNPIRKENDPGHNFSYEFLSPQKILTGCSGTEFASGEVKRVYFFVDATGKKKFISPNKSAEVVFPTPSGLPGLTRVQRVFMQEMCFPAPCKVQGFCSPGSTIGPTGWNFPKCKCKSVSFCQFVTD